MENVQLMTSDKIAELESSKGFSRKFIRDFNKDWHGVMEAAKKLKERKKHEKI